MYQLGLRIIYVLVLMLPLSLGKIKEADAAAELLEKEKISAELIDLRTIRPLDINTILESKKQIVCNLRESWPFGNI